VQSVHAFGEDRWLAGVFSVFMIAIVVFSFGLVLYRLPLLKSRHELDSWMSREAAFLANNWILLFSAFFVLFATMFPTLAEAVTGQRLTVGPPFFNKWMLPIGLILLLLTGIAPLLAWRKTTLSNLLVLFTWPAAATIVTGAAVYALGIRVWTSGLCFAFCAFVFVTIIQEFVRGAAVRKGATGTDVVTAMIGLVGRSRRRYGGYIVHVGIVLMFLGFAGQGYKQDAQLLLKPGQQATVGAFVIRHDALTVTSDEQKQMITGHVTVTRDGKALGQMEPAKWFYARHEEQPTSEVAIRRAPGEDLYIVLAGYQVETQTATYAVTINPLINWIWLGFGVLAVGTGIALLPERAFAFAAAKLPAGAVTTGLMLLLLLLPATGRAQDQTADQRGARVKALEGQFMCMCGGCRAAMNNCPMAPNCHGLRDQEPKIEAYIAQGLSDDAIKAAFVKEYGEAILLEPPDKGFNKLAWLFPYLIGGAGAAAIGVVAWRWSHPSSQPAAVAAVQPAPAEDAALQEKLDDELRDLD
jgi:cytochrome c-type biogenesis protein CcmF